MDCNQAQNSLPALMSGELWGEEARALRRHLASCAHCSSKLTAPQWVEVAPALEEEVELSDAFQQRFQQKLAARPSSRLRGMLAWRWPQQLAAAGALAAVFALGMLMGRYPGARPEGTLSKGDAAIAEKLPILKDMAVINNLDLLEDFETIKALPDLRREPAAH